VIRLGTLASVLGCASLVMLASANVAGSQGAAAGAGEARRIVFDPQPGSRVGKTFRVEHALDTIALSVGSGGETKDLPRIKILTTETLGVDDEYRASAGGRPTSLRRVYQEIVHDYRAFAPGADEPAQHLTATSPLASFSVLFTWVPEESAYGRLYDMVEGVEESLSALSEDLDLRELLPPREVRVGETWSIEPGRLRELLSIGGLVPLEWKPEEDDPALRNLATGVGGALNEAFGDAARGRVVGELTGVTRAESGDRAEIGVTIELETTRDQTELLRNRMTRAEVMRGSIVTRGAITLKWSAHGKLTWDLKANRVHAFELEGTEEIEREIDVGGGSEKGGQTEKAHLKGPLKITLAVGAPRAIPSAPSPETAPPAPAPAEDDGN
jgi:hypothetical protein